MKFDLTSSVPVCTTSIPGLFSTCLIDGRRYQKSENGYRGWMFHSLYNSNLVW